MCILGWGWARPLLKVHTNVWLEVPGPCAHPCAPKMLHAVSQKLRNFVKSIHGPLREIRVSSLDNWEDRDGIYQSRMTVRWALCRNPNSESPPPKNSLLTSRLNCSTSPLEYSQDSEVQYVQNTIIVISPILLFLSFPNLRDTLSVWSCA